MQYARDIKDLHLFESYSKREPNLYERSAEDKLYTGVYARAAEDVLEDVLTLLRRLNTPPVEVIGSTKYVGEGGIATMSAGGDEPVTKLSVDGLNSCWGILAVGPNGALGAHLSPIEAEAAQMIPQIKSQLRTGGYTKVYTMQPNEGDPRIVTLVNDATSKISTQHQLYRVVKGKTSGNELTVTFVNGRPQVSQGPSSRGASPVNRTPSPSKGGSPSRSGTSSRGRH